METIKTDKGEALLVKYLVHGEYRDEKYLRERFVSQITSNLSYSMYSTNPIKFFKELDQLTNVDCFSIDYIIEQLKTRWSYDIKKIVEID